MSVGFLMPCHSTPWRSHLVFPSIEAWALSCEPPLGLNETQKKVYLDEADQFYENPTNFLQTHMAGGLWHIPRRPSYQSLSPPQPIQAHPQSSRKEYMHEWPDYLVFFAQLEPTMRTTLRSSSYSECWRTWNTAWHDDSRRKGDIVVWCLDPMEQHTWRQTQQQKHAQHRDKQFERIVSGFQKEAAAKKKKTPTRSSSWDISNFLHMRKLSSSTAWYRSSPFNWKANLPWPFTAKKQTYLPSWLTQWPLPSWLSTKKEYPYIPKFLQNYLPQNRASSSWFPFSFSWPWNKKKRSGYPRMSELERDLWS
jgi:phosphatidylinositol glycan class B